MDSSTICVFRVTNGKSLRSIRKLFEMVVRFASRRVAETAEKIGNRSQASNPLTTTSGKLGVADERR